VDSEGSLTLATWAGRPAGNGRDHERAARWSPAWLLAVPLLCLAFAAPAQGATPLRTIVEDVPGATAYSYGTRDHLGNEMLALKVVKSRFGGYVGVYHTVTNGRYAVKVGTSLDLLNWRFAANLAQDASQPTIRPMRWGSALVAYTSQAGCPGGQRCLALRYYGTESALLSGVAGRSAVLSRTLSSCAEGTPNIYSAASNLSNVDLGFHYLQDCRLARQARGTLRNFDPLTWAPAATPGVDNGIINAGASPDGKIGDRDGGFFDGAYQRVIEAQIGAASDMSSWRAFLWTGSATTQLAIRTHGGSVAFASPTYTPLPLPNGEPGVVVTLFLPSAGAAPGEVGELVYYRPESPPPSPTIAAAGDISCQNTSCHDDETSNLLVADPPTKVLTLGDNQYENGELVHFEKYYMPDWGRVKSITMPSPGNHDPPASGYTAYYGKPANYSYDLGKWHLISLDSTNITGATAFLDSDLAQNPGRRCILAYWHHPRFSSGSSHGNNSALGPLWTRLYAAGADVILNGHEHIYERFAPQTPSAVASPTGIRQFTAGTGGKALHGIGTVRANSEVRLASVYGVLRMTLHPTSYEWRLQGEDGQTYDSGATDCS
jgi:acid phosphatase type 7